MSGTLFKHHLKTIWGSAMLEIDINLVHCSKLYQCSACYRLMNNNRRQRGISPLVFLMACLNTIPLNRKQNKGQAIKDLRRKFFSLKEYLRTRGANIAFVLGHAYISISCVIDRRKYPLFLFKDPSIRGFKVFEATQFLFKQSVSLFMWVDCF